MPPPHATIVDARGRIIEMKDSSFDSFLILHDNGQDNHTLTLVLKLHLNKIAPTRFSFPFLGDIQLPFPDHDKRLFTIKPWTPTEFAAFSKDFLRQCGMWNNHFWLAPPAGFSALDVTVAGRSVRPNIWLYRLSCG
jgi:hypothetical protein